MEPLDPQESAHPRPATARPEGLPQPHPHPSGTATGPGAPSGPRPAGNASEGPFQGCLDALGAVLRGKDDAVRAALTCVIAGGHLLLEDIPGTGKTTLARALAAALGLEFRRIQMTADLLPQDLTGASYPDLNEGTEAARRLPLARSLRFVPGPIFTELLLADELNRTPPRTQSALLEAMAERGVTVDGELHALPHPFIVVATQNPTEFAGTFPLPESQLDRFMMRLAPGYPDRAHERQILRDRRHGDPLAELVTRAEDAAARRSLVEQAMRDVEEVAVAEPVLDYLLDIIRATRGEETQPGVLGGRYLLGASPRAAIDLDRACRARALLEGRDHVLPDDVATLSVPVLAHRLVPDSNGFESHDAVEIHASGAALRALVDSIPPPRLNQDGEFVR